jgi:hypothetical protein
MACKASIDLGEKGPLYNCGQRRNAHSLYSVVFAWRSVSGSQIQISTEGKPFFDSWAGSGIRRRLAGGTPVGRWLSGGQIASQCRAVCATHLIVEGGTRLVRSLGGYIVSGHDVLSNSGSQY